MTDSQERNMTPSPCMNCFTLVCGSGIKCAEMTEWVRIRNIEANQRIKRTRMIKDSVLDRIFDDLEKANANLNRKR